MATTCFPIFFILNICYTLGTYQAFTACFIFFFSPHLSLSDLESLTLRLTSYRSSYHRKKRLEGGCILVGRVPHGNALVSDEKAYKLNPSEGGKDTQHLIAKYKLNNYLSISFSSTCCCTSQWYKSLKIFFSCVNISAGLLLLNVSLIEFKILLRRPFWFWWLWPYASSPSMISFRRIRRLLMSNPTAFIKNRKRGGTNTASMPSPYSPVFPVPPPPLLPLTTSD